MRNMRCILARYFFRILGLSFKEKRKKVTNVWRNRRGFPSHNLTAHGQSKIDDVPRDVVTNKRDLEFRKIKSRRLVKFKRVTSGTTGIRAEIALDREDMSRMLGVRDYCLQYYGLKLGAREARCWGQHHLALKKRMINFLMNRKYFYLTGNDSFKVIDEVKKWDPDYIYGYSSLIISLAKECESVGLKLKNLKLVICTAETILPHQKRYLANVFGAPVAEEYGATEFDIIGFECRKGHLHVVNPWLSFSENENNTLITDCARIYQPITKYDLGDDLEMGFSFCNELGSTCVINKINGRSIDMLAYSPTGKLFHSVEFAYAFDEYFRFNEKVFDFKVIQDKIGLFTIYVSEDLFGAERDLVEFISKFVGKKIGENVEVKFGGFKEFFIDKNKRSYFIQNLNPNDFG